VHISFQKYVLKTKNGSFKEKYVDYMKLLGIPLSCAKNVYFVFLIIYTFEQILSFNSKLYRVSKRGKFFFTKIKRCFFVFEHELSASIYFSQFKKMFNVVTTLTIGFAFQ